MIARIAKGLLILLVVVVAGGALLSATARDVGDSSVPSGARRNQALYVTMRDGVRIAIDLWLPPTLAAGQKVPTLIHSTRYVRATAPGPLARIATWFGRYTALDPRTRMINAAGYAAVLVDARGSGASTGQRNIEWSPDELADYGEIVDWVVKQPWSNGRVGGWGVSYDGNTAEMLAATGRRAVHAVAPLYDDYDAPVDLVMPGGLFAEGFIADWGAANHALDHNDYCALTGARGVGCFIQKQFVRGIKPVDADRGGHLLDSIVRARSNYDVLREMQQLENPRDTFPTSKLSFDAISPFGMRAKVESLATPMLVRVGWLDAGTVNVALGRFLTLRTPQQLEIGPWSHGGGHHVDPFLPDSTPTDPPREAQVAQMLTFFDGFLKDSIATPTHRVRYYTMNGGGWHTSDHWPPEWLASVRWYFNAAHALTRNPPTDTAGSDAYHVDTTVTTGAQNRWHTQLGGFDVIYPDRAAEDKKLLVYTSAPLEKDVEVTGVPVVWLRASSTHDDGAFFAYLEDVAPDGRVTYVTEGILRARHRKVSTAAPPYVVFGPYHTYAKADAAPLVPGQPADIPFELFATSVRLKAGHRIRLALGGADRSMFAMVPRHDAPTWTVLRSAAQPSWLELPMKEVPRTYASELVGACRSVYSRDAGGLHA
ncbi:MAG: CocE/NonD family hydrolase [Gemmatimonadaceae bacterium]